MKTPLVIYHSPCMDGYTAAWACWLVHPEWEFVPGVHGYTVPLEDMVGRDVYFLDFSYKRPVMEQVINVARSVTVLDHHVSAESDLKELFDLKQIKGVFDAKHSGAYLAWRHFHPDEEVPQLVLFVEDRDLWLFRYEETRPVCDAIFSHAYSFQMWNNFNTMCEAGYDGWSILVKEGLAIGRKQAKDVAELTAKLKYHMMIAGKVVPVVNVPYIYASDVGELLYQDPKVPFAATYFYDGDNYIFSLRSSETGDDVSEVAKVYGGGGHKHSAGFQISRLEDLE
jgi:oligoribonuclease NrnB/cAMP/cGMP phosphodiesterase (DHH superfamily)